MVFLCLVSFPAFSEASYQESDHFSSSPIYVTAAGTFIRYGNYTLYLPDIYLPSQIVSTLLQASASVVYRKLMHHLITAGIAVSDEWLSQKTYKQLRRWYRDGTLLMPLKAWYAFNLILRGCRGAAALYHESYNRFMNVYGRQRVGRVPLYPGKYLDQAVNINVLLGVSSGFGNGSRIEITPLKTVLLSSPLTKWEASFASLTNTLMHNKVELLWLAEGENGELQLKWLWQTEQGSVWQEKSLHHPEQGTNKSLISWLRDSYSENTGNEELVSAVSPESLRCIETIIKNPETTCEARDSLQVSDNAMYGSMKESRFISPSDQGSGNGLLRVVNNRSWSPGLPGTMFMTNSVYTSLHDLESGQIHFPYWASLAAEALLHEVAVAFAEKFVGVAFESFNDWYHKASEYTYDKTLKERMGSQGSIAVVERVKNKSGKFWVRKTAPWLPINDSDKHAYFDLAGENRTLSQLDSEHIIKSHDSWIENPGSDKARLIMITEYGGDDTSAKLPVDFEEYREYMTGALKGIEAIHQSNRGHFDITASNILKGTDGTIKIGDLGSARHLDKNGTAFSFKSNPCYRAPERLKGAAVSEAVDIWGLGTAGVYWLRYLEVEGSSIAWKMLRNANEKQHNFVLGDYIKPERILEKEQGVFYLLNRMLSADKNQRPSASQLLLDPFLQQPAECD